MSFEQKILKPIDSKDVIRIIDHYQHQTLVLNLNSEKLNIPDQAYLCACFLPYDHKKILESEERKKLLHAKIYELDAQDLNEISKLFEEHDQKKLQITVEHYLYIIGYSHDFLQVFASEYLQISELINMILEKLIVSMYPNITSKFPITQLFDEICSKGKEEVFENYIKVTVNKHVICYTHNPNEYYEDWREIIAIDEKEINATLDSLISWTEKLWRVNSAYKLCNRIIRIVRLPLSDEKYLKTKELVDIYCEIYKYDQKEVNTALYDEFDIRPYIITF